MKTIYYKWVNRRANFYLLLDSTGEAYIAKKPSPWPKLIKLANRLNIIAFIIILIAITISHYVG